MIRFAAQNGECAIELFDEDETHHLMRECHLRERYFSIGTLVNFRCKAVWSADNEKQPACALHCGFLYEFGELARCELRSVFVQNYDVVGRCYFVQYRFGFALFLLQLAHILRITYVRQDFYVEWRVMHDARDIFLNAVLEIFLVGLAD